MGAIAYYLGNQVEVDTYLKKKRAAYEDARRSQTHVSKDLRERIERSREHFGQAR
jgi:hypothetical protein